CRDVVEHRLRDTSRTMKQIERHAIRQGIVHYTRQRIWYAAADRTTCIRPGRTECVDELTGEEDVADTLRDLGHSPRKRACQLPGSGQMRQTPRHKHQVTVIRDLRRPKLHQAPLYIGELEAEGVVEIIRRH